MDLVKNGIVIGNASDSLDMYSWKIAEQRCMPQVSPTLECAQGEFEVQLVEDSRNQVKIF
jgi:hypothetical protein